MAISSSDIADILNVSKENILAQIKQGVPEDIVTYILDDQAILIVNPKHEQFVKGVLSVIKGFHRRNPLNNKGISKAELIASLGVGEGTSGEKLLELVLADLKKQGLVEQRGKNWAIFGQKVELGQKLERDISLVENHFKNCGMQVPLKSELELLAKKNQISDKDLKQILHYLVKEAKAYKIGEEYIHASIVDACRQKLLQKLVQTRQGLKVSDFRDLVAGNRKICLLLLAQYDNEGVTKRNGDFRAITDKGIKYLKH